MQTLTPEIEKIIQEQVNERVEAALADFEKRLSAVEQTANKKKVAIVLSSNDFDKVLPAFIIATGAASFGLQASIFFTLWGLTILKEKTIFSGKKITEQMLTMMLPSTVEDIGLSKMNMLGLGAKMMKMMLKENNVASIPELMDLASNMGVELIACKMTMGIMGISDEEIRKDVTFGGVATFIGDATESAFTIFI
ncbi:MAG: DsrE/DsrF/DrsH-like family protein [Bacteroidia bacterium]|nr:DsrE/DsrF/DrsH-like family protein [Bacteroidia bacterium]